MTETLAEGIVIANRARYFHVILDLNGLDPMDVWARRASFRE